MKRLVYIGMLMMFPLLIWAEELEGDTIILDPWELENTGLYYYRYGEFEKAEEYLTLAYLVHQENIGHQYVDEEYGKLAVYLGDVYHAIGNYDLAEKYYAYGVNILNRTSKSRINYVWALVQEGYLFFHRGDAEPARENFEKALIFQENYYGKQSDEYANGLMRLGDVSWLKKDFQQALRYYSDALNVYNKMPLNSGDHRTSIANLYRSLGVTYYALHDYKQALYYYEEALDTYNSIPENHRYRREKSYLYCDIGAAYYHLGDYKSALDYLTSSSHSKEIWKPGDPMYLVLDKDLGFVYLATGQYDKAEDCYQEMMRLSKQRFIETTDYMSEKQRDAYWETVEAYHHIDFPRFAYRSYPYLQNATSFAYDNELFKKGLLLTATNIIRQAIFESDDERLIRSYVQLQKYIVEAKPLIDSIITARDYNRYIAETEKYLIKQSAPYREKYLRQWNITWDSVRVALKPNQVAIEFMAAPLNEDSTMYCALLLRHDSKQPKLIPLFNEKDVESQLNTSTINQADISRTYAYDERGGRLAKLVWSAILPYLKETDEVYFSPTGVLHQLAIENLPFDATSSMADHYNLYRLSSTRELALNRPPVTYQTATLYGGISYAEMSDSAMIANSQKYATRGFERLSDDESFDETLRSTITKDLPGTAEEVEVIAPILEKHHIAVSVFMKDTANEESVKALSGQKKNLLHFATHGFFLPDNGSGKDPLERSGLVFAGVDKLLRLGNKGVPENVDDGILTSKEIALLDLREADIVVLSACETGLGDISGDGVFGLQRAFKMAGAQTILMALWQVSDEATRMLMTAFYRHYTAGESKREAFRNAQQEVRSSKYKSPYFWAGFVLLD